MKDLDALPIEIDGFTIYVTNMEFNEKDQLVVDMLPDESLPDYFDEVFISSAIHNIIANMYNNALEG